MKPTNWRTYYGYRPSRSLVWREYRVSGKDAGTEYFEWLCRERGLDPDQARERILAQSPCGIIKAEYAPEPVQLVVKASRPDPVNVMCAKIRDKLSWEDVERLQNAIDQRLAA